MFLNRKTAGLLIRSFAGKPELVAKQVQDVLATVETARAVTVQGQRALKRIDVLVSADKRFLDADCGETAGALRKELGGLLDECVYVSEVKRGDIFCSLLNYGVAHQVRAGIDYTTILSTGVRSYFNTPTFEAMCEAAENGAYIIPVMLNELAESIGKGCAANTLCMWKNEPLLTVGGFDLFAHQKTVPGGKMPTGEMLAWKEPEKEDGLVVDDGVYAYPLAGVEEIIPTARQVGLFGKVIAPILPQGEGLKQWQAPDSVTDPDGYKRHVNKMGAKLVRQLAMAARAGVDLSYLQAGVMDGYRH